MLVLTKIRLEKGMSMNQLSSVAELSPQTIQDQERGKTKNIYPNTAKKIVDALGVDMWDIYECVYDRQLVCREVE